MQLSMDLAAPPTKWPSKTRAQGDNSLFFAVLLDTEAAADAEALGSKFRIHYGLSGRPVSAKRLRITLNAIADYANLLEYDVSAAMQAAATIKASPFEVTLNRALSLEGGDQNPLVLGCGEGISALNALQKSLSAALNITGYEAGGTSGFTPYVTLLYDRKSIDETTLDDPIRWIVRDFALIYSVYGESRHVHLGNWQLQG
jgi:2'-5' RNA ligase